MNTVEAINYEKSVLESAKLWINGEASIDNQVELVMIASEYGVKLPSCMYHFQYSNNPNEVCLTGAVKTIYKVMTRLAKAICERESLTCKYRLE